MKRIFPCVLSFLLVFAFSSCSIEFAPDFGDLSQGEAILVSVEKSLSDDGVYSLSQEQFFLESILAYALDSYSEEDGVFTNLAVAEGCTLNGTLEIDSSKALNGKNMTAELSMTMGEDLVELLLDANVNYMGDNPFSIENLQSLEASINGAKVTFDKPFHPLCLYVNSVVEEVKDLVAAFKADRKLTEKTIGEYFFQIEKGSWYIPADNAGAIVFRCPAIDDMVHKVNFKTANGELQLMFDGWGVYNYASGKMLPTLRPCIKKSDSKEDVKALNLFEKAINSMMYISHYYMMGEGLPEGLTTEDSITYFFSDCHIEDFYGEDVVVNGKVGMEFNPERMIFQLAFGEDEVTVSFFQNMETNTMEFYDMTINDKSYFYLEDALYQATSDMSFITTYLPQVVRAVLEADPDGVALSKAGNVYTLDEFQYDSGSSDPEKYATGTVTIDGDNVSFRNLVVSYSVFGERTFTASGTLDDKGRLEAWTSFSFQGEDKDYTSHLNVYNTMVQQMNQQEDKRASF